MTEQNILTPIEAINEFYRLKDKYEIGFYEKYVKSIVKSNKSNREKRVEYSKLPKHECINCKRNVGTIFSINTDTKEQIKKYKAKCGDIQDPCPLDIQIDYCIREIMDNLIKEGLVDIEKIKLDIIKEKNNALFFGSNVVNIFQKLTQQLKFETEHTGFIIETNILRNDNPEKKNLIKETIDEFGKGYILPFKEMIKEFDETNNELKINEAIQFYVNEMVPKLKEIQLLKYKINMIEYDEKDNIYKLIQLPYSLENKEYYDADDDKVIKFVKGVRKEKKKTRKEEIEVKSKSKTRKIKPMLDLIIEEDVEQPPVEIPLESKFEEPDQINPIFDESGNLEWPNKDYQELWNRIPSTVKNILLEDKDWLVDLINKCYKLRKNGEPCNLFLPNTTKLPPQLLENGKYDFGSEVVNKLFNSLSKSYQNTLLTLYTENDGVKNYNMLKETLEKILAKNINFDRGYF